MRASSSRQWPGLKRRRGGFDPFEEMIALVEHEGADLGQQHALLAAARRVDDRLAVVAALADPEAVDGRLQAFGVVAGNLGLQALGLFLQDGGDRIVNGGGDDADAERDHDGRRGELPSRHARRARHHELEPPRQAEKARHRADQHAERQDPLGDLRHAKQRNLGDEQRGYASDRRRAAASCST